MAAPAIKLRRADLHQQVWKASVAAVARRLGVDPGTVANACKRLHIPVPPWGYWPRVLAGKPVRKPNLAPLPPGSRDWTVVRPAVPLPSRLGLDRDIRRQLNEMMELARNLDSVEPGRRKHPIVRSWLEKAKRDDYEPRFGRTRSAHPPVGNTEVQRRILSIMNGLFLALERCSFRIEARSGRITARCKSLGDEPIDFNVYERGKAKLVSLNGSASSNSQKSKRRFRERMKPTGIVAVSIRSYSGPQMRRYWKDLPNLPVEKRLGEIVETFIRTAANLKQLERIREQASAKSRIRRIPARSGEVSSGIHLARLLSTMLRVRKIEASPQLANAVEAALKIKGLDAADRATLRNWRSLKRRTSRSSA